jgi:hypothetical protein
MIEPLLLEFTTAGINQPSNGSELQSGEGFLPFEFKARFDGPRNREKQFVVFSVP